MELHLNPTVGISNQTLHYSTKKKKKDQNRWKARSLVPVSQVVNVKEKFLKEIKCSSVNKQMIRK